MQVTNTKPSTIRIYRNTFVNEKATEQLLKTERLGLFEPVLIGRDQGALDIREDEAAGNTKKVAGIII